jgi:HAD superfamily hydrolase (TIGR01549 family)
MAAELVIFDMDGTITQELLDFDAIRRDIGLKDREPILEAIEKLTPEERERAEAILHEHEITAAGKCELNEGAVETLAELKRRGIRTALLTRNSAHCAKVVLERHGLSFDYVASREDRPHKPHPESILNIVRRFNVEKAQTFMVGDYLYDLEAASAAGVRSVLVCLKDGGKRPAFAAKATFCVTKLEAILDLVSV